MRSRNIQGNWNKNTQWEFIESDSIRKDMSISGVTVIPIINKLVYLTKTSRGWEVPGGHVELNETAEAAAARELREETGINSSNFKLIGYRVVTSKISVINKKDGHKYPKKSQMPTFLVTEGTIGNFYGGEVLDSKGFQISDAVIKMNPLADLIYFAFQKIQNG